MNKIKSSPQAISMVELRSTLSERMVESRYRGTNFVAVKNGRPIGAIISFDEYSRLFDFDTADLEKQIHDLKKSSDDFGPKGELTTQE